MAPRGQGPARRMGGHLRSLEVRGKIESLRIDGRPSPTPRSWAKAAVSDKPPARLVAGGCFFRTVRGCTEHRALEVAAWWRDPPGATVLVTGAGRAGFDRLRSSPQQHPPGKRGGRRAPHQIPF